MDASISRGVLFFLTNCIPDLGMKVVHVKIEEIEISNKKMERNRTKLVV